MLSHPAIGWKGSNDFLFLARLRCPYSRLLWKRRLVARRISAHSSPNQIFHPAPAKSGHPDRSATACWAPPPPSHGPFPAVAAPPSPLPLPSCIGGSKEPDSEGVLRSSGKDGRRPTREWQFG